MHVYEVRVTIETAEELFADTFVGIALTGYIKRAKRRGQLDAWAIEEWEVEEISHKEQEGG